MSVDPDLARELAANASLPRDGRGGASLALWPAALVRRTPKTRTPRYSPDDVRAVLGLAPDHAIDPDRRWWDEASCAGVSPELFFPERGESVKAAKQVCAECTCRPECLLDALNRAERHGIWGGLSELDRRRIRSRRHPPASAA